MNIAIGSLQCESNTLSAMPTRASDFDLAIGKAMCAKVHVMDMLEEAGAQGIPTLYAHALPGGTMVKADYLELAQGIVDRLPQDGLDGVWLYLHGAMYVDQIGSGEAYLLKMVRDKIGSDVPIAIGLDFHANLPDEVFDLANVVCGFRTAPHIDRIETERKTMRLLLKCAKQHLLPRPQAVRAPVVIPGDAVQTALAPLRGIMEEADQMENLPGMLCAQVFNGQAWVDAPYMGPVMVVTHEDDTAFAQACARRLAQRFYRARYDFRFLIDALEPEEAVRAALNAPERQVFISDSGDNTTAGAAGDNAYMLNLLMRMGVKGALVAGIMDGAACDKCYQARIGDTLTLTLGGSLARDSQCATVTGKLVHVGDILGYTGDNAGPSATLALDGITLILTKRRAALTSLEIFESIDMDIRDFKIVVVKLGYLFPDLAAIAPRSILAFTPGESTERLKDMGHKHITRPIFPLDDGFMEI
ncbi:MAG: M81 family metallopeptidase [Clostridia bacterium]